MRRPGGIVLTTCVAALAAFVTVTGQSNPGGSFAANYNQAPRGEGAGPGALPQ